MDEGDRVSVVSELGTLSPAQSLSSELVEGSMQAILRAALERLQLDMPQQAQSALGSLLPAHAALFLFFCSSFKWLFERVTCLLEGH